MLGLTDKQMGQFFGVTEQTLHNWKNEHPDFFEALKMGKFYADSKVAESLYNRATGYSHKAVKIFNNAGTPMLVEYEERFPPDPTSMIFWLKNRQPELWRDKRDFTASGEDDEMPERIEVTIKDARKDRTKS